MSPLVQQSPTPSFTQTTFHNPASEEIPQIVNNLHSTSTSYTPSPKSRQVDLRSPIFEVEEHETSSETADEPLTPLDIHLPHTFQAEMDGHMEYDHKSVFSTTNPKPLLILNTSGTAPTSAEKEMASSIEPKNPKTPKTPCQKRPTLTSRDSGIKRAVTGLFRRSYSHSAYNIPNITTMGGDTLENNGSDPMIGGREHWKLPISRMSANNSPSTSQSNTPPIPGSPAEKMSPQSHLTLLEPSKEDLFGGGMKSRSPTGFSFRDKLSKHKISFAPPEKDFQNGHKPRSHRSTSVDLDSTVVSGLNPHAQLPPRQVWGMAADMGVGLKSRRLSLSLPDDFTVHVVDLYSEFADQSKLVGRRGKSIGKGATAHVRLMNRKGGYVGEVYAVKEFRGKSSNEELEDYEKKIKSEYSIAKSVHHPNIVETIRLCTHNGRWNHVMEFCDQGDLFSLVSQKYLSKEDHLVDRLCLFKQLVQGLSYLHTHGIAHRDVKLENLLITRDSKLKITDFGVSEVFCGIHPGLRSAGGQCGKDMGEVRLCDPGMCGSPPYVAPEVVEKKNKYDPRPLDVWGAAVVMLCMAANGCLWQEAKMGNSPLYDDLIKGWTKWDSKHVGDSNVGISETDYPYVSFFDQHINPPALRRVLLTMLNPDPSKRVSMAIVAKNRWLKNVECCQVDSYEDPTTTIEASQSTSMNKRTMKVVHHNHLPPSSHLGHKLVRLPGSTDMY